MKTKHHISKCITCWYNGQALMVNEVVANGLKITNGHRIKTESEFWQILGANASHNIAVLKSQIESNSN